MPIRNMSDETDCSDYRDISLLSITVNIMSVGFDVRVQVQTIMDSPDTREEMGVKGTVHQLLINFKKTPQVFRQQLSGSDVLLRWSCSTVVSGRVQRRLTV
jgi:hypothetical protein